MRNFISFFAPPPPIFIGVNRFLLKTLFFLVFIVFVFFSCEKNHNSKDDLLLNSTEMSVSSLSSKELTEKIASSYGVTVSEFSMPSICFDSTGKDTCAYIAHRDTILDIGCDSCLAHVSYDLWVCSEISNGGATITSSVVIDNIEAEPNDDGGCDSLIMAWESLYDSGDTTGLMNAMYQFRRKAIDAVEWLEMNNFVTTFKNIFGCDANNRIAVAKFHQTTCNAWCLRLWPIDLVRKPCGTGCCVRTTRYCWDAVQQKVIKQTPWIQNLTASCPTGGNPCPEGYISFPCFAWCFP